MSLYLNIYSPGPLVIVRVPEKGVPWRKIVQAAGSILRAHGFKKKDISSIDREGLDNIAKLEAAFLGGPGYAAFLLYDFDCDTNEFRLARGVDPIVAWEYRATELMGGTPLFTVLTADQSEARREVYGLGRTTGDIDCGFIDLVPIHRSERECNG